MYILYLKEPRSELDRDEEEAKILWTLEDCLKKDANLNFLLVHYPEDNISPTDFCTIRGKTGYELYLKSKQSNLSDKSIMQLKKEMFDIMDGKTPKTR